MPDVPPLIGLANSANIASLYNNGNRRFFEPYIIDRYGDRGDYHGQQANACTTGPCSTLETGPGNSASSTLWNGRANPAWSPDGTNIVYWQALVTSPACGPANGSVPVCPTSSEPGGRHTRLMIAHLTVGVRCRSLSLHPSPMISRGESSIRPVNPSRPVSIFPAGPTPLKGKVFGSASVASRTTRLTPTSPRDDHVHQLLR